MDMLEELTGRFTAAIREALPKKTPLIGTRWVQRTGKKNSGHFRFIGCPKLAKATKSRPRRMADRIVGCLRVDDLNVNVEVSDDGIISVVPKAAADARSK